MTDGRAISPKFRSQADLVSFFAPFRVSLAGGGTDLPEFYNTEGGGVVSLTLEIGVTVTLLRPRFPGYILQHSGIEHAATLDQISHGLVRESIRLSGVKAHVHVAVQSQLPFGTGLGTSSTLCVALLGALRHFGYENHDPRELAEKAYFVERNMLGGMAGKQDQYAAAFGGFNLISFSRNKVDVSPIPMAPAKIKHFEENLLLFYTGGTRDANTTLKNISVMTDARRISLNKMLGLARDLHSVVAADSPDMKEVGRIVEENWLMKRGLTENVSSSSVDEMHDSAIAAGAYGAKLLGAGTEGFMLVVAAPSRHAAVRTALSGKLEVSLKVGLQGASLRSLHPS